VRSRAARTAILVATIAAIAVLFVVLGGDDGGGGGGGEAAGTQTEGTTTERSGTTERTQTRERPPEPPPPPRIVVEGGRPRGGVERLSFESGDRIRFVVRSDVADEVHVHGYDITRPVPAGGSVRLSFPARLEGVFEVELHDSGQQIAELRVSPG
jgi:hypothetical protein